MRVGPLDSGPIVAFWPARHPAPMPHARKRPPRAHCTNGVDWAALAGQILPPLSHFPVTPPDLTRHLAALLSQAPNLVHHGRAGGSIIDGCVVRPPAWC